MQYRICESQLGIDGGIGDPPKVSSRPSTSMTSKMPGEASEPVSAARNGCATAPSLTPLRRRSRAAGFEAAALPLAVGQTG